jgi:hypothetical protein
MNTVFWKMPNKLIIVCKIPVLVLDTELTLFKTTTTIFSYHVCSIRVQEQFLSFVKFLSQCLLVRQQSLTESRNMLLVSTVRSTNFSAKPGEALEWYKVLLKDGSSMYFNLARERSKLTQQRCGLADLAWNSLFRWQAMCVSRNTYYIRSDVIRLFLPMQSR